MWGLDMTDAFERAILAGSIRALRGRAAALRARASVGVTLVDRGRQRPVIVITSEAATSLRISKSWDAIADTLEAEAAS
jgi:hypothetical protein